MYKKEKKMEKKSLKEQNLQGFTIVEFSLATAFIATLLISITVVAGMVTQIYQKGLTLKSVNSTGRGLIDEFTSNINAAPSVDTTSLCNSFFKGSVVQADSGALACKSDYANRFIFRERTGTYSDETKRGENEGTRDVQLGGVFCTGKYSYIWNTYYGLHRKSTTSSAMSLTYLDADSKIGVRTLEEFRLLQVYDPTYRVCSSLLDPEKGYFEGDMEPEDGGTRNVDITRLATTHNNPIPTPTDGLLTASDVDLYLYELTIFPISQDQVTLRTFMTGTFILGTDRGNVNIERSGDYCDVQDYTEDNGELLTVGSEFTYCGINKFNFSARTAGM